MSIPPYQPQPTACNARSENTLEKLKNRLPKRHKVLKNRPDSPINKRSCNGLQATDKNRFKVITVDRTLTTPPALNELPIPTTLEGVTQAKRSLLRASTNNLENTIIKLENLKKVEAQVVEKTIDEMLENLSNVTITPDSL